jgi:hypothetical protein
MSLLDKGIDQMVVGYRGQEGGSLHANRVPLDFQWGKYQRFKFRVQSKRTEVQSPGMRPKTK